MSDWFYFCDLHGVRGSPPFGEGTMTGYQRCGALMLDGSYCDLLVGLARRVVRDAD